MSDAAKRDAKGNTERAIIALAKLNGSIDADCWHMILRDDLPHIEANIAHLRGIAENAFRARNGRGWETEQ